MITTQIAEGQVPYVVEAMVTLCGTDIAVNIGGGLRPHIGAVALAMPRPSIRSDGNISATASVLCILGHKEDVLARTAALHLARAFHKVVLVSVGLHVENATSEDIECLNKNFDILLTLIETWLQKYTY
jgi:gallate decarboxylase subunit D